MNVLVAGTRWGAAWLQTLSSSKTFTTAAVLARGSKRSQKVAAHFGVPLVTEVSKVPKNVDIACVAVGSWRGGDAVMYDLLDSGIHVIAEHPIQVGVVREALARAERAHVCFNVNFHFGDWPVSRRFASYVRELSALYGPPLAAVGTCCQTSLCGALDIILRALHTSGPIAGFDQPSVLNQTSVSDIALANQIRTCTGLVGDIALSVNFPSHYPLDDCGQFRESGADQKLGFVRWTIGFKRGTLDLREASGPITWQFNPGIRSDKKQKRRWLYRNVMEVLRSARPDPRQDALLYALERFSRQIETGNVPWEQTSEYLTNVALLYSKLLPKKDEHGAWPIEYGFHPV